MEETYKNKKIITPENVREIFHYDYASGFLFWKPRSADYFEDGKGHRTKEWKALCWNNKNQFRLAGSPHNSGYWAIHISKGKEDHNYLAHVLVWLWHYGDWPINQIDHKNGIRFDNRIENLSDVSHKENHKNRKTQVDNSSGFRGISWDKSKNRYRVYIGHENKLIILGSFKKEEIQEAIKVRLKAEREYGFHENHGRE